MVTEHFLQKHFLDYSFLRYFTAGVLTISLHMTFLLFTETPTNNADITTNAKHVTLLPLKSKTLSEKKLLEWMRIMDSTCVIKPDRKNGFSITPGNPPVKDEKISFKKHLSQIRERAFSPLTVPVEKRDNKIKRFWKYSTAPIRQFSFSTVECTEKTYPLWIRENGTVLPQLFRDIENVRKSLEKQKITLSETVLRAESRGSDLFPRIRIDVSCGNPEFDRLAMRALAINGKGLFDEKKGDSEPYFIAVKWSR